MCVGGGICNQYRYIRNDGKFPLLNKISRFLNFQKNRDFSNEVSTRHRQNINFIWFFLILFLKLLKISLCSVSYKPNYWLFLDFLPIFRTSFETRCFEFVLAFKNLKASYKSKNKVVQIKEIRKYLLYDESFDITSIRLQYSKIHGLHKGSYKYSQSHELFNDESLINFS